MLGIFGSFNARGQQLCGTSNIVELPGIQPGERESVAKPMHGGGVAGGSSHVAPSELDPGGGGETEEKVCEGN